MLQCLPTNIKSSDGNLWFLVTRKPEIVQLQPAHNRMWSEQEMQQQCGREEKGEEIAYFVH